MKQGIAVDIDEVLSDTAHFWMDIINKKFGNSENLSSAELFKKYRLTYNVPGWADGPAEDFLENMRHDNNSFKNVPAIKGSAECINKIDKIISINCYLTIRPEAMREGTEQWLRDNGFPKRRIIMKPNNIATKVGNKWKAKILSSLYADVIGIIDDNPGLINLLPDNYGGTVFLYGHKEYNSNKIKVISCENWKNVIFEIRKFVKNYETIHRALR